MVAILLGAGMMAALAVGSWNIYASLGASSGHDWRTDRASLTPPGGDNQLTYLTLWTLAASTIAIVAHAPLTVIMAIGFVYSVLFARFAIRSRRRAAIWFRVNPAPIGSEPQA